MDKVEDAILSLREEGILGASSQAVVVVVREECSMESLFDDDDDDDDDDDISLNRIEQASRRLHRGGGFFLGHRRTSSLREAGDVAPPTATEGSWASAPDLWPMTPPRRMTAPPPRLRQGGP